MNILFVGVNDTLFYLVMQYTENSGDFLTRLQIGNKDLKEIREELLLRNDDVIVYDYEAFEKFNQKEFIATLIAVSEAKRNDTIIYSAMGSDTKFVNSLKGVGFTKILTTNNEPELRISLENALKAPKTKTSEEEMEKIAQNREDVALQYGGIRSQMFDAATNQEGTVKIAVAGCLQRIGTTAVALQFCKTLNLQKQNSCGYIDVNGRYLTNLSRFYFTEPIENGIKYGDVSLYKDVISLKTEGFDYLVYDFGELTDENIMSILDKDIVVIVGQAGPSEIEAYTPIMSKTKNSPVVNYVFYNAPKSKEDREEIYRSMGDFKDRTFLLEHVSDPFILDSNNRTVINNILNQVNESLGQKKKARFIDRLFS